MDFRENCAINAEESYKKAGRPYKTLAFARLMKMLRKNSQFQCTQNLPPNSATPEKKANQFRRD